jgi:site-specific DNA-methyltransferase (adenine-specific)
MRLFYDEDGVRLYHGDVLEWLTFEPLPGDVMVTDPPYGINYKSGTFGTLPRSIAGDGDTATRDAVLEAWGLKPALVFGTWRAVRPEATRMLLIWDTKGALGMGDLSLPWKPAHQEIYVLGSGFSGKRTSDVLTYAPVQAKAANGRIHPHQKPVDLMVGLIQKCPPGIILDPFAGSGSTLVAAKKCGREAVGFELDEAYCLKAARRLDQGVLAL